MRRPQPRAGGAIRAAAPADAEALAALSGQLGYPTTAGEVRERLAAIAARGDGVVLVAELDGVVVGWLHVLGAHLLESPDYAEIGGLVVAEEARGQGLGWRLMDAAERWARAMGYAEVHVRSNVVREAAHRFYEGLGYRRVKQQMVFVRRLGQPDGGRD